jgi:ribonuclease HII
MPDIYEFTLAPFMEAGRIEAGCDEAGRGCLAGPVTAAAVILPADFYHPLLNDSKKMTEKTREELREIIIKEAVTWAVEICTPKEIDKLNILWASVAAMHKALLKLDRTPEHILVDGNRFKPFKKVRHTCVIKGDGKYMFIAAASVLAKTFRDDTMRELHEKFPVYGWNQNKGYPTGLHRQAIESHGSCLHHRKSFTLLPVQTELIF